MLTASVESTNVIRKIGQTISTFKPLLMEFLYPIIYQITVVEVTTTIQEQSINSNILLRGKISFHIRGFEIIIDLSMVIRSTAACDA